MKLRCFSEKDQQPMLQMLTSPLVSKTYMLPDFSSPEKAIPLFHRFIELSHNPQRFVRGIDHQGTLVGFLNDVEVVDGSIELGYVIHPDHWGKGYATEALKIAIRELLDLGFQTVITGAFQENPASLRVMEKAGMTRLDKQDLIDYRGVTHTCLYYHMTEKKTTP